MKNEQEKKEYFVGDIVEKTLEQREKISEDKAVRKAFKDYNSKNDRKIKNVGIFKKDIWSMMSNIEKSKYVDLRYTNFIKDLLKDDIISIRKRENRMFEYLEKSVEYYNWVVDVYAIQHNFKKNIKSVKIYDVKKNIWDKMGYYEKNEFYSNLNGGDISICVEDKNIKNTFFIGEIEMKEEIGMKEIEMTKEEIKERIRILEEERIRIMEGEIEIKEEKEKILEVDIYTYTTDFENDFNKIIVKCFCKLHEFKYKKFIYYYNFKVHIQIFGEIDEKVYVYESYPYEL